MYELYNLLVLSAILAVVSVSLAFDVYLTRSEAQAMEDFDPETLIQNVLENQDKTIARHEASSAGGVARSSALRMKDLDKIVGQGLIDQSDPVVKAAMNFFPGLGEWLEDNPDLAGAALQKLSPYLQEFLGAKGNTSGQSGPTGKGGW